MLIQDSTLALAGIFQSADLVKQVARTGKIDDAPFSVSIESVLRQDAPSTQAVYGGVESLRHGLQVLSTQLSNHQEGRDTDVLRYALGVMVLERKLIKQPQMLQRISKGISQAQQQAEMFGVLHPNVIANLASLYSETLSTFNYRIHVRGNPELLHTDVQVNRIRALLLTGIRSAVLWRQKGGGRLQLLFRRRKILDSVNRTLAQLHSTQEG